MKLWRGQPDHFKPSLSPKEMGNLWLGLTAIFYALAADAYFSPASVPATGRWAWLKNIFSDQFGSFGIVILYLILGTSGLVLALSYHAKYPRKRRDHGK